MMLISNVYKVMETMMQKRTWWGTRWDISRLHLPNQWGIAWQGKWTEIYQCHKCGSFTWFPKYNAASFVIHHEQGQCSEYSILLYWILSLTGLTMWG
jgi:hypothetical protein